MAESVAGSLRERRRVAGMSQRDLARASGVAQPNIAAYESGRRAPSVQTLAKLDAGLSTLTLERVRSFRSQILEAAARHRLADVRVFGSVARGEATAGSDLDLLVHPGIDASLFDLAAFMVDVEAILGVSVDVVSDASDGRVADLGRAEAIAL
ncbi:helix-turn-helix domain-containing protein [Microbacterium thalassium]|uniref:Putative nucleotidyltransferase n=1 Tax=Microbacterium thalassium TaxID=362649 RepID=A0A7X0KVX3_9MICO|nr:helix-turn-helix domain-containing protein [Microbacterium thalassium]MBB6392701.1 putative nucleotidyltransferase [Microbacterium thalassium]GLK23068.1 hypothetical protein GCM10017607_03860 [Microbacterium thalassium]